MAAAPIYLDHQATTPCDPAVVEVMAPLWSDGFANPSSRSHRPGLEAAAQLTLARERLAQCLAALHGKPRELLAALIILDTWQPRLRGRSLCLF